MGTVGASWPDSFGRRWMITVDEAKLHEFIGRMLGDRGGADRVTLVRIGATFGLYTA